MKLTVVIFMADGEPNTVVVCKGYIGHDQALREAVVESLGHDRPFPITEAEIKEQEAHLRNIFDDIHIVTSESANWS